MFIFSVLNGAPIFTVLAGLGILLFWFVIATVAALTKDIIQVHTLFGHFGFSLTVGVFLFFIGTLFALFFTLLRYQHSIIIKVIIMYIYILILKLDIIKT